MKNIHSKIMKSKDTFRSCVEDLEKKLETFEKESKLFESVFLELDGIERDVLKTCREYKKREDDDEEVFLSEEFRSLQVSRNIDIIRKSLNMSSPNLRINTSNYLNNNDSDDEVLRDDSESEGEEDVTIVEPGNMDLDSRKTLEFSINLEDFEDDENLIISRTSNVEEENEGEGELDKTVEDEDVENTKIIEISIPSKIEENGCLLSYTSKNKISGISSEIVEKEISSEIGSEEIVEEKLEETLPIFI